MKTLWLFAFLLASCFANAAALTGFVYGGWGPGPTYRIEITDGTSTLTGVGLSTSSRCTTFLPPGSQCTIDSSFNYQTPLLSFEDGVGGGSLGSVAVSVVGAPVTVTVGANGRGEYTVPVTLSGTIQIRDLNTGACLWCDTFVGAGTARSLYIPAPPDEIVSRRVDFQLDSSPVPESASISMLVASGAGLAALVRRRNSNR